MKKVILLFALFEAIVVVAQVETDKLPRAIPAPDTRPQLCSAEPLETPLPRWRQGSLTAELVVGSDGMIHGLRTVQTSYSEVEKAAFERILRKWRFKPTYYQGHYVNAKLVVEIKASKAELNIRFPESGCRAAPGATM